MHRSAGYRRTDDVCMETVAHANVCFCIENESGILFSFVVFTFSMLSLCSRIAIQFSFVRSVSLSSLHFIYLVKDVVLFPIKMKEKKKKRICSVLATSEPQLFASARSE